MIKCTFQNLIRGTQKEKNFFIMYDYQSNHSTESPVIFKVTNMMKCKYIYMVSQILTNVKEITLVTWMLPARTPTDPMFVNAALDLMEMVESAHVNLIYLLKYLEYSCSSLTWSCWGGHVISLSYINYTGSVLSLPGAVLKCAVWERRSSNSDPAEFLWISNFTVLASKP